jgi:hypothetical protein
MTAVSKPKSSDPSAATMALSRRSKPPEFVDELAVLGCEGRGVCMSEKVDILRKILRNYKMECGFRHRGWI